MKKRLYVASTLCAFFAASAAKAEIVTLNFSGAFTGAYTLTAPGAVFGPGHQGFTGGPDQTWGFTSSDGNGGWLDFYSDGESIGLEAGAKTGFFQSATTFFATEVILNYGTMDEPRQLIDLTFPGLTPGHSETVTLSGDETLVLTAVPEPTTWAMMVLGFLTLGFAGVRAKRPTRFAENSV